MVNPNDPSPATTDSRTLDSLDDQGLAAALARGAGERLLALRCEADAGKWHSGTGFDERSFKDAGDTVSQRWLAEALALARPKDVILSEEATDDAA
ncbi:MAG: hypothetical protein FWG11_06155, partial [Promicromonosporaceae bacterium]|nr:hypothetical protein [Promicromonosporaceae bacterium]